MESREIYVRLEDPSGKHADIVSHHQAWDLGKFLEHLVHRATQAEYRKFMGYKPEYC